MQRSMRGLMENAMSETTADNATTETVSRESAATGQEANATVADEFKPITSQEELNRTLADRLARERAKFGDYGDLKAKAAQFDAIAEAQKTELQRYQERAEAAEARAQLLESTQQVAAWKTQIAAASGIPAGALRGSTEEELLAHAEELKALLPDPRRGAQVSTEGRGVASNSMTPAQEFAEIFRRT